MAEWLVEAGIGETRAVLVEGDRILEARIIPDGELIAGTVVEARLVARIPERGQGIVAWDGHEALVSPLPAGVTEGALTRVEIVRPAIPEPGKPKRARARPSDAEPAPAPSLDGRALRHTDPDLLEAAGWSELIEEAATGVVAFPGGELRIALTPAMTLIDVDGTLASAPLAIAGARAAAEAIRRLDIAGSIGIDLPGGADKAVRHAAAEAIDAALPQPFERTAVNGFGFVQIVRPRRRRSLPEIYAMEPAPAHARALLRRAERTSGAGARTLTAHPAVIAAIAPGWREELARRLGTEIVLREDASLTMSGGHVQAQFA
ncbi:ribonuclease [Sphingomonas cannabina]|uniref:ribonuclease n=1 Tax=Sphingomonas cannabina TaxID=2899123 RepID=UPI001F1EFC63|nr:ribonuclease [Sphingomonas cannabina]UIJ44658.1 ribonuclease [Sphingomonas cannabina]